MDKRWVNPNSKLQWRGLSPAQRRDPNCGVKKTMTKMTKHEWRRQDNPSLDLEFCPIADCWKVYYLPTLQFGRGSTPRAAKLALFAIIQREGIKRHWWKFQGIDGFSSDYEENT